MLAGSPGIRSHHVNAPKKEHETEIKRLTKLLSELTAEIKRLNTLVDVLQQRLKFDAESKKRMDILNVQLLGEGQCCGASLPRKTRRVGHNGEGGRSFKNDLDFSKSTLNRTKFLREKILDPCNFFWVKPVNEASIKEGRILNLLGDRICR